MKEEIFGEYKLSISCSMTSNILIPANDNLDKEVFLTNYKNEWKQLIASVTICPSIENPPVKDFRRLDFESEIFALEDITQDREDIYLEFEKRIKDYLIEHGLKDFKSLYQLPSKAGALTIVRNVPLRLKLKEFSAPKLH